MIMLVGPATGEPLSYRGRVILHDGPAEEIMFILPMVRCVQLPGTAIHVADRIGRPVMMLKDHPDMASVRWPIERRNFHV